MITLGYAPRLAISRRGRVDRVVEFLVVWPRDNYLVVPDVVSGL